MSERKIDITSTVIEKAIDAAKDFLGKLIGPAVEEAGLIFKDQVSLWRTQNQIKILNKARTYCEKKNIKPSSINFKVMLPLLENAGLEDDDEMQDQWAHLLSNMADSSQNIQNHVFPYILSQLSKEECLDLKIIYQDYITRQHKLREQLTELRIQEKREKPVLTKELNELRTRLSQDPPQPSDISIESRTYELQSLIMNFFQLEKSVIAQLKSPAFVPQNNLKLFELANLIRLGLIEKQSISEAKASPLKLPNLKDYGKDRIDIKVTIRSEYHYILTELGIIFLGALTEKDIA